MQQILLEIESAILKIGGPKHFFHYYRRLNFLQPRSRPGILKNLGNEVSFATGNARGKGLL